MSDFLVLHYLPEFVQILVHCVNDAIQSPHPLSHPLLFLTSTFPRIRVFSIESVLHVRCPKYWSFSFSFSFSISPFNEYLGLNFFRMDWFDFLALQGILKSLSLAPQFESINSLVLSLLFGPSLTTVHDYWKNRRFEYMDLCWQSDVSDF